MIRLGRGDSSGAIEDGVALLRLGQLLGRKGLLLENLVGISIQSMGHRVIGLSIDSGNCTEIDLQRLSTDLESIQEFSLMMKKHLQYERLTMLDTAVRIARGQISLDLSKREKKIPVLAQLWISSVDWETVMNVFNRFFDDIDKTLEDPAFVEAAESEENSESRIKKRQRDMTISVATSLVGGRRARGRISAVFLLEMLTLGLELTQAANCRSAAEARMTRLAVALERYRKANNEFPETLHSLVPVFLKKLPRDPFGGKPFVYRRNDDKTFTLYSRHQNQKDDGGNFDQSNMRKNDHPWAPTIRTVKDWIEAKVEKDDE
jgi:hypothetical protein